MTKYYRLTGISKDLPKSERNEDNREIIYGSFLRSDTTYEKECCSEEYTKMKIEITNEEVDPTNEVSIADVAEQKRDELEDA